MERSTPLLAKPILACGLAASLAGTGARAEDAAQAFDVGESLARGRFTLELRPRWNRITESNKPEVSEGGTVRVMPGWISAPYRGLRLTVEAIHANQWLRSDFNDDGALFATSPYPLLPDPRYTGVNQAHVEYTGIENLRARLGRQVVRLDNQRWVSDNGFRQIQQVFDGVAVSYEGFERVQLSAAHFRHMRTTSGAAADLKLTTLHAAWNPAAGHSVAAYAVLHDQAQNGAFTGFADSSYRVVGVKAEGALAGRGELALPYIAEFAQQRRYAGGDSRIDADYWRLGAGIGAAAWTARYDYEVKGSNSGLYGVQNPLTDFYAFNGWALHFFNTPRFGLRDAWLTLRHTFGDFTFYGEAHRFWSDYRRIDYGRELDLGITYAFRENCQLRLQHARYGPGPGTPDPRVHKTWLTLTYVY